MALQKNKVLLHACCAVCLGYSIEKLLKMGYEVIAYFYNPNIYPDTEYQRRKVEFIKFCTDKKYNFIVDEENSYSDWIEYIKGYDNEPEKGQRCNLCFEYRLQKTAKKACELNIDKISTTLTISPHKVSKNIFLVGKKVCENSGIKFLEIDFKKEDGFLKTNKIARENNLYRQEYCGCEFSIR